MKFIFSATNQHGVHSPFVYKYLTQCLYQKKVHKASKSIVVLLQSIPYFKIKTCIIHSKNNGIKKLIYSNFKQIVFDGTSVDIMYIDNLTKTVFNDQIYIDNRLHNDSIVLINGIHQNKNTNTLWERLKNMEQVKISIDFFHCGVLFFRREQEKQHFKIRL